MASPTNPKLKAILKKYFGFDEFRGLQENIIEDLLNHQDVLVLMPTGGGKSLCYQIPALMREGVALVVSPLISLMEDQVSALRTQGIKAAFYNSSLSVDESREVLAALHQNELDLLYIAPERLISLNFLERLESCKIALFAIDEAHCISQWGHDFRPEYAQLGQLKQYFPDVPIIALTATANQETRDDIVQKLNYNPKFYVASFNRPNIYYRVLFKHQPFQQLLKFLASQAPHSGIIYCGTRVQVDSLTQKLNHHQIDAKSYHAGLDFTTRRQVQTLFRHDKIAVVVATVAFGMGIDKPNVRFVVHYDLPKSIEGYYQETGRAGRDGLPAQALTLYDPADTNYLRNWIHTISDPNKQRSEAQKLNHMIAFAEARHCRRQILLRYFDETLAKACGHCDVCTHPPKTTDATEDVQRFLSCIYRLKQNYGLAYVIDILRGSTNAKILQANHHQLSTHGIGRYQSTYFWKQLGWQLIHQEFCFQDANHFNVLRLTPKAIDVLKNKQAVMLALPEAPLLSESTKKMTKLTATNIDPLYEPLRLMRKKIADEENKPPFMIFSDNTLQDIAKFKPTTLKALLTISGIGQYKLNRYGPMVLKTLEIAEA